MLSALRKKTHAPRVMGAIRSPPIGLMRTWFDRRLHAKHQRALQLVIGEELDSTSALHRRGFVRWYVK